MYFSSQVDLATNTMRLLLCQRHYTYGYK